MIGRKSFTDCRLATLGIGITVPCFQSSGKIPVFKDLLIMSNNSVGQINQTSSARVVV